MGIYTNNRGVNSIFIGGRPIVAVYTNGYRIWPDALNNILSCFYNGYWIDEYSWTDDKPWTD